MPDTTPSQGGAPAAPATPAPAVQQQAAPLTVSVREVDAFTARLIGNHGTAEAALRKIAGEQIRFRKRAQHAEKRAEDAEAKIKDAVVLVGDEAKAYNELKTAGYATLTTVPAAISRLKTLETASATKSVEEGLKESVGKKYKIPALKKMLPADVQLEFDTVKVKGKDQAGKDTIEDTKEAYVVTVKDGVKTREKLDQYLEREVDADILNVLKVDEQAPGTKTKGSSSSSSTPKSGLSVPRQQSSTTTTPKDKEADAVKVVDATLGAKYSSPGQRAKAAAGGDKS